MTISPLYINHRHYRHRSLRNTVSTESFLAIKWPESLAEARFSLPSSTDKYRPEQAFCNLDICPCTPPTHSQSGWRQFESARGHHEKPHAKGYVPSGMLLVELLSCASRLHRPCRTQHTRPRQGHSHQRRHHSKQHQHAQIRRYPTRQDTPIACRKRACQNIIAPVSRREPRQALHVRVHKFKLDLENRTQIAVAYYRSLK